MLRTFEPPWTSGRMSRQARPGWAGSGALADHPARGSGDRIVTPYAATATRRDAYCTRSTWMLDVSSTAPSYRVTTQVSLVGHDSVWPRYWVGDQFCR